MLYIWKAIWSAPGLHAVLTVYLRFSSGTKTIWPKPALLRVQKRGKFRAGTSFFASVR